MAKSLKNGQIPKKATHSAFPRTFPFLFGRKCLKHNNNKKGKTEVQHSKKSASHSATNDIKCKMILLGTSLLPLQGFRELKMKLQGITDVWGKPGK